MPDNYLIFCEESGDKGIPWKIGSSHFYVVTAVLVKKEHEEQFLETIDKYKRKVLQMRAPLEWKKLRIDLKRDDKVISRFLRKVGEEGPPFLVTNVICNKHETTGRGMVDHYTFMNYLYGLMFKRISWFLKARNAKATLYIDRNTDKYAQESLRQYISTVSRIQTGEHPRHSKPKWINPEEHQILGLADFISGISLRSLSDYHENVNPGCKACSKQNCIFTCTTSNFKYYRSYKYIVDWNEHVFDNWNWRGLIYHPFEFKDNYRHIIRPR